MGHLLRTVNPEAADRADGLPRPLPEIGTMVHFYPRLGEVRRGRRKVAAIVLWADESNRLLDLVVMHEATDFIGQERVPERTGDDRGWARIEAGGTGDDIAALRASIAALGAKCAELAKVPAMVLGDFDEPEESVLGLIDALDERVGKIEDAAPKVAPPVKKKVGRPRIVR